MTAFGIGLTGVSQKGNYCTFKTKSEIDEAVLNDTESKTVSYTVSDAECVIKKLNYDNPKPIDDFHYQSYSGEKFDVEMLFFDLSKKTNLSKIRRIEFAEGVEIVGSGHTGRLSIGKVTEYSISGDTIKILGNINDY